MFAKRLFQKAIHHHHPQDVNIGMTQMDLNLHVALHYGIPLTASILAFDPIQHLLAIGTLDGRIKVIGGDNIEGLLISQKQLPFKYLEFLVNQGFLVSISNDNDIQVWNLESRCIACSLQWESNITAFSIISGSSFMYIGDEYGLTSVLKCEAEDGKLLQLPYHIPLDSLSEAAGILCGSRQMIVGVLPQPCSSAHRVLIAYESGLIILWDVVEGRIVVVRGNTVQPKDGVIHSPTELDTSLSDNTSEQHLGEKEISALCWASSCGSILAVGYVDGDILFWKTSTAASNNRNQTGLSSSKSVVKLQLSSAEKRIPVIFLQWCPRNKSGSDGDGQLLVYGGDEIGSEEALTVLTLEWSSDMETLRCVSRVDLTLIGSFADMVLLPNDGTTSTNNCALFVLTNPGQLHYYSNDKMSSLASSQERQILGPGMAFPAVIPMVDPLLTVTLLSSSPSGGSSSKALSEIAPLMKLGSTITSSGVPNWPLTGGVPNQMSISEDKMVERVYIAGYQDGSVRMWDATYPILTLLCVLKGEVTGVEVSGSSASVSSVDFCFPTLSLAIGNGSGLVRVYNLNVSLDETSFKYVSETKHEAHNLPRGKGPNCRAAFSLLNSPVRKLLFVNNGSKLAVGYECGTVMVLDMSSLSVLFSKNIGSGPGSSIVSMTWKAFMPTSNKSPKHSGPKIPDHRAEELVFILTSDAKVYAIDGYNGNMISSNPMHLKKETTVVSMYVIDGNKTISGISNRKPQKLSAAGNEPSSHEIIQSEIGQLEGAENLKDSLLLLCCKDALHLYPTKSAMQGENKSICKLKLEHPCCWTTTFKKDEKVCGLVLLYQTGGIEIRSLPDLELVKESSLMSILRWSFKANMEKTMSSTDDGHIALANGSELAFISLVAGEDDFRILETLPSLHDKVVAAAAEAAYSFSSNPKKKQDTKSGILGGILKGLKGEVNHSEHHKATFNQLEAIFLKNPFPDPDPSPSLADNEEVVELDIDDIEIDEPIFGASSSSHQRENNGKEEKETSDREKLLGRDADAKPRIRTPEEIIAAYRKTGDASSIAGQAKDKLLERQQRLERISKRAEELSNGAENFKSMADELVKAMEARKWWQY